MMKSNRAGVLLMAYGSPPSTDEAAVAQYLRHITRFYRGSDPSPEAVAHLQHRYETIGGSPLYAIAWRLTEALQRALDLAFPRRFRVYLGMKHSSPFIEEVVSAMARDGIERAVGIALAPFRSRMSTEGYYHIVRQASKRLAHPIAWVFASDWHTHPLFLYLWETRIRDALRTMLMPTLVVFTNHSLPARIREERDPYSVQFEETARTLAERCRLVRWTIAYQSAGEGGAWLRPDLLEVIDGIRAEASSVLVVPIGFVMDHLEVLYDVDMEAAAYAQARGLQLTRTRMPNDDPLMVALLVDLVRASDPLG